jgi:ribosome modulation factor
MATALRLDTREQRKKLPPRDKPYFFDLRRGLSIGYRKGLEGGSCRDVALYRSSLVRFRWLDEELRPTMGRSRSIYF